jgi:hypothetical protein
MSDGLGTVMLRGEYGGDLEGIAKTLQRYIGEPNEIEFRVAHNLIFPYSADENSYADIFPRRKMRPLDFDPEPFTVETYKALWEREFAAKVTLEEFAADFFKSSFTGFMEIIGLVWDYGADFAELEHLMIRSKGLVKFTRSRLSQDCPDTFFDTFTYQFSQ